MLGLFLLPRWAQMQIMTPFSSQIRQEDTGSVGSANSDDVEVMETAFRTLLVDQRQVRVVDCHIWCC